MLGAILILAPLFIGALIYGVFMWLRYSLAMPACVVEDVYPPDKRSGAAST